jgi:hypothetical protein
MMDYVRSQQLTTPKEIPLHDFSSPELVFPGTIKKSYSAVVGVGRLLLTNDDIAQIWVIDIPNSSRRLQSIHRK